MPTTVRQLLETKGPELHTIAPVASVYEAIERMAEKGVGALVVTSKTGRLQGILSERDCFRKVLLKGRSPHKVPVREVMTREPICVSLDSTVEDCLRLMDAHKIRHLPVMREGRVVGMISMRDLVAFLSRERDQAIHRLEKYIEETP